jgi:hypothetical protein
MEKGWIDEKRNRLNNPHYNPDALLDFAIDKLDLKNDAGLARLLGMNPATISKIRHRVFPIGDAILVDLAEALDMPTKGLKRIAGMIGGARQKVFISGPMTGIENFNYPAFNRVALALRKLGYVVLNPAENPEQDSWEGYMRLALIQMLQADIVAQLPGWQDSRGARMEHDVADELHIPCMTAESLLCQNPVAIHLIGQENRIDLGAPLEFCGVDIDACHKPANERAAA